MFMSRPQRFPMDHSLFLKTDLLARLTTVRASKVTIDKRHTCRIYCLPASETGASCNGSDFGDVTYPFSSSVWKTQLTGTPLSVPWCLNLLMPKNAACVCDIFVSQDLKFIFFCALDFGISDIIGPIWQALRTTSWPPILLRPDTI